MVGRDHEREHPTHRAVGGCTHTPHQAVMRDVHLLLVSRPLDLLRDGMAMLL